LSGPRPPRRPPRSGTGTVFWGGISACTRCGAVVGTGGDGIGVAVGTGGAFVTISATGDAVGTAIGVVGGAAGFEWATGAEVIGGVSEGVEPGAADPDPANTRYP